MINMRLFAVLVAASIIPAAALAETTVISGDQPIIEGSGHIVRQVRPVAAFTKVDLKGSPDVEVQLGRTRSLSIEADDNLLRLLTSDVHGNTLVLGSHGSYRTRFTPRVVVTTPDVSEVVSEGSGDVNLLGVANSGLTLTIQGSGDMKALGRTARLEASVDGSGDMQLQGLSARDAVVAVHGSGKATVFVTGALDASSYGSGNLRYVGRPASLSVHRGGSGQVAAIRGQ